MSRARKGTDLYVGASAFEDGITPGLHEVSNPMHGVQKRFLISRAKDLASDDLPEPFGVGHAPLVDTRVAPEPSDSEPSAPDDRPTHRYLVGMLGRRPQFLAERADYDRVARAITSYRARYEVQDVEGIGDPPLEAFQRSAYRTVLTQVRDYQRHLGLELGIEGPHFGRGR